MSKHAKYVPKHRQQPARPALAAAPRKALRTSVVLSSVAVTATGVVVSGGVAATTARISPVADALAETAAASAAGDVGAAGSLELPEREEALTRSDRRDEADPAKEAALAAEEGPAITGTESLSDADPRDIGRALLDEFGFSTDQFGCLDSLWVSESNWRVDADNPTSSAYGIPQALTQLHDLPDGYMTSAEVQIRWGLGYIRDAYGTPCNAWAFKQGHNWY